METTPSATAQCMELLKAGVPLTLLWDLTHPGVSASTEILTAEPADTGWVSRSRHAVA